MVQRTVLKVAVSCQKCKKKVLKAVSALEGVDKIEIDEAKGTLIVTGNADPYDIIVRARKTGKLAEVVAVGPPPKQDAQKKPQEKKPEEKKPEQKAAAIHDPLTCPQCQRIVVVPMSYHEPDSSCSIL